MSTSPTPHASASDSSAILLLPQTRADVRSQAVARLQRATSLPRTSEGRRPQPVAQAISQTPNGPATLTIQPSHYDTQEVLSPSPVESMFHQSSLTPSATGTGMQCSASTSSSYHVPSPPHITLGHPFGTAFHSSSSSTSVHPDWSAKPLTQSYLSSLSPGAIAGSSLVSSNPPILGRKTPSPLPTLVELRTLQRSNSAAARAQAMSKLTGGRETPSDEDHMTYAGSSRPLLQRADSLDAQRGFGFTAARAAHTRPKEESLVANLAEARPRLQRSFTVSSSNMGEESRSAVGRRMVELLAEKRALRDRDKDEITVRQSWKDRRVVQREELDSVEHSLNQDDTAVIPALEKSSSTEMSWPNPSQLPRGNLLAAPDRSASQNTDRSGEEAFEYAVHLRRSFSSRTARGTLGTASDPDPSVISQLLKDEELHEVQHNTHSQPQLQAAMFDTRHTIDTPIKHAPQSFRSNGEPALDDSSPSRQSIMSRDALVSMIAGPSSASGLVGAGKHNRANWPTGVHDSGGSDWGTPAKDIHQPTFKESPFLRSPLSPALPLFPVQPTLPETSEDDESLTPPRGSGRTSFMSWEEVGGLADQEVPIDARYYQKSGSISAKIGHNIRTAMRKKSQSRSSHTSSTKTSPPTSPQTFTGAIQSFSRRGSETSVSPSHLSFTRSLLKGSPKSQKSDLPQRHPSITSLYLSQVESSENSILLQHQLSADPSPMAYLPRADLSDPRIHSSKLSPFPGISQLERRDPEGLSSGRPPFLHQNSDSVVLSQRITPASSTLHGLPLQPTYSLVSRRDSDDGVAKRGWLAKALSQQYSPRLSGSVSRQGSNPDATGEGIRVGRQTSGGGHPSPTLSSLSYDPFAGPPLPQMDTTRHRSASPSVSIVPEDSEEGSRLTRFTMTTHRIEHASPVIEDEEESQVKGDRLPQKSIEVLNRMDALLALASDDPTRPDILDDPPRKLLLATQVLQVVNMHTAKDRFLLLFNDILVIAKPIITSGSTATLNMQFVVKSIVSLDKLHISRFDPEPKTEPERHVVVQRFIEQFAQDPILACRYLVERSNPRVDAVTLASLIFKTPELDKGQIGLLLTSNNGLMEAFVDRFHFTRVRIDNALRMFLLSLRLPAERKASEILISGFVRGYTHANRETIAYDIDMGIGLVLSIMQLNDKLYGIYGFAKATGHSAEDEFVMTWQEQDPQELVSKEVLVGIYRSIKHQPLARALDSEAEKTQSRKVVIEPARFPPKLTYNIWSEDICVSIPSLDPYLGIRLSGEGLEFEPPVLNFSHQPHAIFRVRGSSIGLKSIIFDRFDRNAALYASLGNARTVSVERAFMSHTLQASFISHTAASKRKYCFSFNDAKSRSRWDSLLCRQIQATSAENLRTKTAEHPLIRMAAEGVALQVLRDAVIPADEKTSDRLTQRAKRTGSVSVIHDAQSARNEEESGPLFPSKPGLAEGKLGGMMQISTGKELVLLCRQNSLLPGVLELLQAGIGTLKTHERDERSEPEEKQMVEETVKARVACGRV